ncbi:MAG TPA: fumarylacetoacetate hydrolase family protein [Sphingobium sp.]|uniref:fumarylacetoacetate hydrolase family protein n=1 Tax=Sphingobium sp. TaxID=1912891 RepID=UPI002ED6709B
MKLARIKTSETDERLALVGENSVRLIEDVSIDDLVAIAMKRDPSSLNLGRELSFQDIRFLSPLRRPVSIRDFSAFEAHTKNVMEGGGGTMNPDWYQFPIFYFSNPNCVIGNRDEVAPPRSTKALDFELEVACVVGAPMRDVTEDAKDWASSIAGFMLMNDWSARDLGAREMKLLFGPAKAKDFATSFGPWLVTPDEFEISDGRFDLPLTARVNDEVWSNGNVSELHFNWAQILARASADATLYPGDVIGSGTCGSGCILELRVTKGRDKHPWLKAGDVVELSAPGLGTLSNRVVAP